MNDELFDSLALLEREKNIKTDVLLDAIGKSLETACRNNYGRPDLTNIVVDLNAQKKAFAIYLNKTVVEEVEDELTEISLPDAMMIDSGYQLGDIVPVDINSRQFGRIAVQNAKNVILQQIREAERKSLYADYYDKENRVITGRVQRYIGRNVSINLGKVEAVLQESEMIKGESFYPNQKVRVYVVRVENSTKGPRIILSRKSSNLVKCLFETEVAEVADGTVEIKAIAREAGSRSKMAVWSSQENVDPVGACVGQNGGRVAAIVEELDGEKIDIVKWNENPAYFIENALSPAKVVTVIVDEEEKKASVVVPDYQLSLAIGKEGQNARLTAKLTGYKIDIKSETQAIESGELQQFQDDYYGGPGYDENGELYDDIYYDENGQAYDAEGKMIDDSAFYAGEGDAPDEYSFEESGAGSADDQEAPSLDTDEIPDSFEAPEGEGPDF